MLDPSGSLEIVGNVTPRYAPQLLREFGHIPNEDDMRPGDLVLFSALVPSKGSEKIISVQQNGGFDAESARWHHSALYLGDGEILEARPFGGVIISSLYDHVLENRLLFRRDVNRSVDEQWNICVQGMKEYGKSYSFWTVPLIYFHSKRGFWNRIPGQAARIEMRRSRICSQLYYFAYTAATHNLLVKRPLSAIMPADLRHTTVLNNVNVRWKKIVST